MQGRHSTPRVVPDWAKERLVPGLPAVAAGRSGVPRCHVQSRRRACEKARFHGQTASTLAAKLVGRWPSGAPIARSPHADDVALGKNDFANNHFAFQNASTPIPLKNAPPHVPDTFAQAAADLDGLTCPHAAHIRKVNPRDLGTDTGGTHDTLTRRILRRGIPYGDPMPAQVRIRPRAGGPRAALPLLPDFDRGPVRIPHQSLGQHRWRLQRTEASTSSSAKTEAARDANAPLTCRRKAIRSQT